MYMLTILKPLNSTQERNNNMSKELYGSTISETVDPFGLNTIKSAFNKRLVAGGVAVLTTLTACSSESTFDYEPASATTEEIADSSSSTTAGESSDPTIEAQQDIDIEELIDNIYKNPETNFQCVDEGVETGTLDVADNGEIIEVLYSEMNVNRDTTSTDERRWSDAPSSPVTADLDDREAVAQEIYAAWCAQPDLLVDALVFEANLTIGDRIVGEEVEWLKEFVVPVEDINEVADKHRLPHQGNQLTAEQLAENKAANDNRIELAEKLANAYYNKENYGVKMDASIERSIALDPLSATYETDKASEYVETTGYTGDVLEHGITVKIGDCAILLTGFNVEDKRPVVIINSENSCDTPEEPETPGTTTTTVGGNTSTTAGGNTTTTVGTTTTTEGETTTTSTTEQYKIPGTTTKAADVTSTTQAPTTWTRPSTTTADTIPADHREDEVVIVDTTPPPTYQEPDEAPLDTTPALVTTDDPAATTPTTTTPGNEGNGEFNASGL